MSKILGETLISIAVICVYQQTLVQLQYSKKMVLSFTGWTVQSADDIGNYLIFMDANGGFSLSSRVRCFGTDIFAPANLERTLRELNDPKITQKAFGAYEADGDAKQSAVLIPLCLHNNKPSILFNLRSNKLTRHKGYPCFPGGVAEDTDPDRTHTALRETQEELGIQPADVKVIGTLPTFKLPKDKMEITAVIADIGDIDSHKLDINYDEVSVVFSRTIEELCDPRNIGDTSFRGFHEGVIYSTPVFIAGNFKIWGVTGMLLHIFLGRLVPEVYRKPLRPVNFRRSYEPKNKTDVK